MPIAYFSMEIGIDPDMPTYSGGLGVLAGDTLRAAADLGIPMVAVTLLYRQGYFRQHLDAYGNQTETTYQWSPELHLELLPPQIKVRLEGRDIIVRVWRYTIMGIRGDTVPVFFLDTDLEPNDPADRNLCGRLYGGDERYRLRQEAILGIGGVRMLRALAYSEIQAFHMNEGHSALLTLALLEEMAPKGSDKKIIEAARESVRQKCVFTTHTPVAAGHDQFPNHMVEEVLSKERLQEIQVKGCCPPNLLNMTSLALYYSRYINGVAMRHGEVSQTMFPDFPIDSITNGVHASTWTSPSFTGLYDLYIPNWRLDNFYLRYAIRIPLPEIHDAHRRAKEALLARVRKQTGISLNPGTMTIGFARRATAYKRPSLLFSNPERLAAISQQAGPIQVIYSGKAHPNDAPGKDLIRSIFNASKILEGKVQVVYLEEYDLALAREICAGVDIWLNTPHKPHEASGTSGMKAALNGVPSFSVLDGWWIEGHVDGVTGWAIGDSGHDAGHEAQEIESLYQKLEQVILPLYYKRPEEFDLVRQSTIAVNGSFFTSQRMMLQYLNNAYAHVQT